MPAGGGELARGAGRTGGAAGEGGINKDGGIDRWIERLRGMDGDLADAEIGQRLAERRLRVPVWWARGGWPKREAWMRANLG